ncbi:MAG: RNA-directed DNA polymerase [Actinomycetota bacterium]|nr:RNA-directed DNA polymerase [Actinomycetota bacterium]
MEEAEYSALGARLAARIERSMHPAVRANRASVDQAAGGRLRLEPFGTARVRWRRHVERLRSQWPATVVLADVRDFYASVRPGVVMEALRRAGCDGEAVAAVGRLLHRWESAGRPGLPIGPLPSAVLANVVLARLDGEIASAGWGHVRWVDDLVVTARERSAGEEILERLGACLAGLGLRLAEEKCRIVDRDDPSMGGAVAGSCAGPTRARHPTATGARGDEAPDRDLLLLERSPGGLDQPVPSDAEADAARREAPHAGNERALGILGALRRLARLRLGAPEGALIGSLADDPVQHELIRAWAWRAVARTAPRAVMERAAGLADEPSPFVRRAVAVAVAVAGGRAARTFLRHHGRSPDGKATAGWGLGR